MTSSILSVVFQGIEAIPVEVQVHTSSGLPAFTIVGLADKAVAESRERVRAAIGSLGLSLPPRRITVNLAPADLNKEGSHFDLPIALGLLAEMGVVPGVEVSDFLVLGELSLDGRISAVAGILPAAMAAIESGKSIICPAANGQEARWAGDMTILAPATLLALINHFKGLQVLSSPEIREIPEKQEFYPDLQSIVGQETAKRAVEIAAAGGHNLLMCGPPGAGKSMLAKCLPGILPPLQSLEMLEVSVIHSVAGLLNDGRLLRSRPFRDPHHSCSMPAMVGGGSRAKPGEVTLAHRGVLFLDELPEFPKQVLDSLRQPVENHTISVARVQSHVTYPADFQLIAAMNPCRCGYLDDPARACNKAPKCAADYQSRISGPLLDRFDIHIDVPAVRLAEISTFAPGESSEAVRRRVTITRNLQRERYAGSGITTNNQADGDWLDHYCTPDAEGKVLLDQAVDRLGLSMRGYTRIRRVARTIADMESSEPVLKRHIAEALGYRQSGLNFKPNARANSNTP